MKTIKVLTQVWMATALVCSLAIVAGFGARVAAQDVRLDSHRAYLCPVEGLLGLRGGGGAACAAQQARFRHRAAIARI